MARHETEMHRQRRIMRDALELIAKGDNAAGVYARNILRDLFGRPDVGLFADHSQMDLQDRKDI